MRLACCATPWRGKECWGPILLRNARQTGIKAVTMICSRAARECCALPREIHSLKELKDDRHIPKAVITVIALALVVLTVENLTYQAKAQQAACGDYIHPCVVTTENPAESPHVVTSMLERQAMTAIERMTKGIMSTIGVTPDSPSQP